MKSSELNWLSANQPSVSEQVVLVDAYDSFNEEIEQKVALKIIAMMKRSDHTISFALEDVSI